MADDLGGMPDDFMDQVRALVAQQIEDYAASQAQMIRASTAYSAAQTGADREAYCAMHHG